MWTVIYVSQSIETAKKLIDVLLTNKVISKLRTLQITAMEMRVVVTRYLYRVRSWKQHRI